MKKIDWIDLIFVVFMMVACAILLMALICAYQESQSLIKWRESTSLEMLEMVKREAVNEYISKTGGL